MTDATLAAGMPWCGGALILAFAWRYRPISVRSDKRRARIPHRGWFGAVGRPLRQLVGRDPDPSADQRLGAALVCGAVVGAFDPVLGVVVALGVWTVSFVRARRRNDREALRLAAELPDLADLMMLAASAGLNVSLALTAVAPHAPPRTKREVTDALDRAAHGQPLAESIEQMASKLGPSSRPLARALVDSLRYGTDLASSLERVANDARLERRRIAEVEARKVPIRMLLPLVFCVLPAFALLTVVPVLITSLDSLRG